MLSYISSDSARFHYFQFGNILCCAMKILMYTPVSMTVYCDVVFSGVCLGFVSRQHNKQLQGWVGINLDFKLSPCSECCMLSSG